MNMSEWDESGRSRRPGGAAGARRSNGPKRKANHDRRRKSTKRQHPYDPLFEHAALYKRAALAWIVGVVLIECYYLYRATSLLDIELQSNPFPGLEQQHLRLPTKAEWVRENPQAPLSQESYNNQPRGPPPPKQILLPKKLITVFGPESSGSTFLATTLGVAVGAFAPDGGWAWIPPWAFSHTVRDAKTGGHIQKPYVQQGRWQHEPKIGLRAISPDGEWEIQHLSLPWGLYCEEGEASHVVEALVPDECFRYERDPHMHRKRAEKLYMATGNKGTGSGTGFDTGGPNPDPEMAKEEDRLRELCRSEAKIAAEDNEWTCGTKCGADEYDGYALYPQRFSVNITSHIEWYLARGVDVTAVLSTRDRTISSRSKLRDHCHLQGVSEKEDEVALNLMKEALEKYGERGSRRGSLAMDMSAKQRAVAVSYEGLMAMQEPFLQEVYHQLGIESDYLPNFADGNAKYVMNITETADLGERSMKEELLQLDYRPPKPNVYEAPPPKQSLLPKRVVTIFGPESSGTKFLSSALGTATGAFPSEGQWTHLSDVEDWIFHKHNFRRAMSPDGEWEVQHLSLPFGYLCEEVAGGMNVVEAYVPSECFRYESDPDLDAESAEHRWNMKSRDEVTGHVDDTLVAEQCRDEVHISEGAPPWTCGAKCGTGKHSGIALYPKRFFINITSHIEWYLSRGVEVTAVLSVRDQSISKRSKERDHCHLPELAEREDELALRLMKEALRKFGRHGTNGKPRAVAVSYEGLMQYKEVHLLGLYKQLGVNSSYLPKSFEDANAKYIGKTEREEVVMKAALGKKSMQDMHKKAH